MYYVNQIFSKVSAMGYLTVPCISILLSLIYLLFTYVPIHPLIPAILAFFALFLMPGFLIRVLTLRPNQFEGNIIRVLVESFIISIVLNLAIFAILGASNNASYSSVLTSIITIGLGSLLLLTKRKVSFGNAKSDRTLIYVSFGFFMISSLVMFSVPRDFTEDETSITTNAINVQDSKIYPIGIQASRFDPLIYLQGRFTWTLLTGYYLEGTGLEAEHLNLLNVMFLPMLSLTGSLFLNMHKKPSWFVASYAIAIISNPLLFTFSSVVLTDMAITFFTLYGVYLFLESFRERFDLNKAIFSIPVLVLAISIKSNFAVLLSLGMIVVFYVLWYKRSKKNFVILSMILFPFILYEIFIDLPYVTAVWFGGNAEKSQDISKFIIFSPLETITSLFVKSNFDQSTLFTFSFDDLLKYFYKLLSPEMLGLVVCSISLSSGLAYIIARKTIVKSVLFYFFIYANIVIVFLFLLSSAAFGDVARYSLYLVPFLIIASFKSLSHLMGAIRMQTIILFGFTSFVFLIIGIYLSAQPGGISTGYYLPNRPLQLGLLLPQLLIFALISIGVLYWRHSIRIRSRLSMINHDSEQSPARHLIALLLVCVIIFPSVSTVIRLLPSSFLYDDHQFDLLAGSVETRASSANLVFSNAFVHLRPFLSSQMQENLLPLPKDKTDFDKLAMHLPSGSVILIDNDPRVNYEYSNRYIKSFTSIDHIPLVGNMNASDTPLVLDIRQNMSNINFPSNPIISDDKYLSFNGRDSQIQINNFTFGNEYTVEILFKPSVSSGEFGKALIMKRYNENSEFFLLIQPNGQLTAFARNETGGVRYFLNSNADLITSGIWYNVKINVNKDFAVMNVNDVSVSVSEVRGNNQDFRLIPKIKDEPLRIGADGTGGFDRYFEGLIEYARVYKNSPTISLLPATTLEKLNLNYGQAKVLQTLDGVQLGKEKSQVAITNISTIASTNQTSLVLGATSLGNNSINLIMYTPRFSEYLRADLKNGSNSLLWRFDNYLQGRMAYGIYLLGPISLVAWDDNGSILYKDTYANFKLEKEMLIYWAFIPIAILIMVTLGGRMSLSVKQDSMKSGDGKVDAVSH
jgi:hypothetical protein